MAATATSTTMGLFVSTTLIGLLSPVIAANGASQANLRGTSLILVKIWCLIIVFSATFAGGISPYFWRWNQSFILLGTQFAGGVFLGTALMHFLSDSAETFHHLTDKEYPFAYMLCTAGYFLTMLGDLVVAWVYAKRAKETETIPVHTSPPLQKTGTNDASPTPSPGTAPTVDTTATASSSFGDTLLLILALCFHSVFEGIAIGVSEREADAWRTLWTVSVHKIFAAIAMGIALLQIIPNRPFLSCAAYSFVFAVSSPIGISIGILIDATSQGNFADWTYAISMSLASGVFIYVAVNHLLGKGISHSHSQNSHNNKHEIPYDKPFYKYMAALLGGGVIGMVMIWD